MDSVLSNEVARRIAADLTTLVSEAEKHGTLPRIKSVAFYFNETELRTIIKLLRSCRGILDPAQPPSKPDAWQYRCKPPGTDKWSNWRPCEDPRDVEDIAKHGKLAGYDAEARPLYAARPPAAPANLVQRCKELLSGGPMGFKADGPLIKALAAEIGGDIATAGALNKTIREALEVVAGQMVAAPVEKSGIMQAAANAADKVASWSPSKREYAERVVGAPAASETCPNCKGTKRATYFSEQQMAHEERDCHLCRPRSSAATGDEPDSRLPLQYEDGPDYCTVKDAQGRDFALTMQPELMQAMERALREDISRLSRPPVTPIEPQTSAATEPLMDAGSIFTYLRERMADETSDSLAIACRALADHLRVLRDVPQTLGQWQPIDTAPREPDAMFMVCAVGDARGPFVVRSDILWRAREAGTPSHLGLDYLTHWMPLPEMPQ